MANGTTPFSLLHTKPGAVILCRRLSSPGQTRTADLVVNRDICPVTPFLALLAILIIQGVTDRVKSHPSRQDQSSQIIDSQMIAKPMPSNASQLCSHSLDWAVREATMDGLVWLIWGR